MILTELLSKGYKVHGITRRASNFNTQRIEHIYQDPHVKNERIISESVLNSFKWIYVLISKERSQSKTK